MDSKALARVSVGNLIGYCFQSGDICSGFSSSSRTTEGIKGHQAVQKAAGEGYLSEIPLSHRVEGKQVDLEVHGRIDGIRQDEEEITLEEIKTTLRSLDEIKEDDYPLHWAQAQCYSYIYSLQNELENIRIQLTYFQIDSQKTKGFTRIFTHNDLERFFMPLVEEYLSWVEMHQEWAVLRDQSIRNLPFPFPNYRQGQRELAAAVYRCIRDEKKLFARAPTGIGKTAATLFPAIKALGEGLTSKIFYLTAKTITRTAAEKAIESMAQSGLRLKTVTITAKDKICFCPEGSCHPLHCPYAEGYYDRIKEGLRDILQLDRFNRSVIEEYARKHRLCPFEFSLDLSLSCDCILCDYNYVFDPRVYLRRFFTDRGGDYAFLIDEAHNLVDRAREMFSAALVKSSVLELKRATKETLPGISRILHQINKFLIQARKRCEEDEKGFTIQKEAPKDIAPPLRKFIDTAEDWLARNHPAPFREKLLELYFDVFHFLRILESYDERYVCYFDKDGRDVKVKLFCLDPSYLLQQAMKKGKATIFFSATLTPMDYFIRLLGGDQDSLRISLPSPFPRENLCLLINDRISTRYKKRESTYDEVAASISAVVRGKMGNYLAFFPSHKYMNEVHTLFCERNPNIQVICQKGNMSETEREDFLETFSSPEDQSLVGFAVMGGIFGEGIDLTGDRLSGAIIIGVGLPQICLENNIIRSYFDENMRRGFEYAYTYPGMNKVLQAVGRVIRSDSDRGVALLIDERFSSPIYKALYPPEWYPVMNVEDDDSLLGNLRVFWEEPDI